MKALLGWTLSAAIMLGIPGAYVAVTSPAEIGQAMVAKKKATKKKAVKKKATKKKATKKKAVKRKANPSGVVPPGRAVLVCLDGVVIVVSEADLESVLLAGGCEAGEGSEMLEGDLCDCIIVDDA